MSVGLYNFVIPEVNRALQSLRTILQKAATKENADALLQKKLADDMLPLSFQIHSVTDIAQKTYSRLTAQEPKTYNRDEITSFTAAYARIDAVEKQLADAESKKSEIEDAAEKTVTLGLGPGKSAQLKGVDYVSGYAFPNLFFHLVTAYSILRKEGVDLGKIDYQGPFLKPFLEGQL